MTSAVITEQLLETFKAMFKEFDIQGFEFSTTYDPEEYLKNQKITVLPNNHVPRDARLLTKPELFLLAILAASNDHSTKGLTETANENRLSFLYHYGKPEFQFYKRPSSDQVNQVSQAFEKAFKELNKLDLLPKNNQMIPLPQPVASSIPVPEIKASSTTEPKQEQSLIALKDKKRKQDHPPQPSASSHRKIKQNLKQDLDPEEYKKIKKARDRLSAKHSREKRKIYVAVLESAVSELTAEIKQKKTQIDKLTQENRQLREYYLQIATLQKPGHLDQNTFLSRTQTILSASVSSSSLFSHKPLPANSHSTSDKKLDSPKLT